MAIEWTPAMLAQLGKVGDKTIALEYGIHISTVAHKRKKLSIPRFSRYEGVPLGSAPDAVLAKQLGMNPANIAQARIRKGKAAYQKQAKWTPEQIALLGTASDADVGKQVGRNKLAVYYARSSRGIPAFDAGLQPENTQ